MYLPPGYGQKIPRALVDMKALERLKGDSEVTKKILSELKTYKDYGPLFGIAVSPSAGLSGAIGYFDSEIADTSRQAQMEFQVGTKNFFSGKFQGKDEQSLSPITVRGDFSYRKAKEFFWGWGVFPSTDNLQEIESSRLATRLVFDMPLFYGIYSSVGGWGKSTDNETLGNTGYLGGPTLQLGFSDTFVSALFGVDIAALGSKANYRLYQGRINSKLGPLFLESEMVYQDGDRVYSEFPSLVRDIEFPGVREGRVRDKGLFTFHAECETKLWGNLSGFVFGGLILSTSEGWDGFGKSGILPAYGLGLTAALTNYSLPSVRAELGVSGSDVVLQVKSRALLF
jgi:hypothetical protein